MTSFILVSNDKKKRQKYIKQFCKERSIDLLDVTVIEKDTAIKKNVNSIGIDEVKNMQKKLFLKPIKSETKAVILEDAQLLTIEAQNALLKSLEEPPDHTIIVLSSESIEPLLATIISRCQIIDIGDKGTGLPEDEIQELEQFLDMLPGMTNGEKLKQAESVSKDKQKAKEWIEKLIIVLRMRLIEHASSKSEKTKETLKMLASLQEKYVLLKTTNSNPRLTMEIALLDLI